MILILRFFYAAHANPRKWFKACIAPLSRLLSMQALCNLIIHSNIHLFPGFLLFALKLVEYPISAFRVFHFQERDSLLHCVTYWLLMYYLMHTYYAFKLKCILSRFHNLSIFLFPSAIVAYILLPAFIQGRLSLIVFLLMKIYFSSSAWSYLNIYIFHRLCWQNTLKVLNIDLGVVNFWHFELK